MRRQRCAVDDIMRSNNVIGIRQGDGAGITEQVNSEHTVAVTVNGYARRDREEEQS